MNELTVRNESRDIEAKRTLIKNMYAKDCSDDEFDVFLFTCKRLGLDPRAKQIYAIKLQGKMTFQIGIDGLRLVAERTGKYAPGRETQYMYDKEGRVFSATAYVKKLVGDTWHEVPATAYMAEYSTGQATWRTKPHIMLGKCAESLALRKAFPMELSGIHSTEEMEQAMQEDKKDSKTVDVAVETETKNGKTMADYEEMAKQLWGMMREKNPQIQPIPPYEMSFYLKHCQNSMANIDMTTQFDKWCLLYDRFSKAMAEWYEAEGQYGYAQRPDHKEVS